MIRLASIVFASALAAAPVPSPLAPAEAFKAFRAALGLRVELVTAEPVVASPCALAFDSKGRCSSPRAAAKAPRGPNPP